MTDNKTAMQEVVEKYKKLNALAFCDWVYHNSNVLLAKEKEQIVKAVKFGNGRAAIEDKTALGEHYYNTKYSNQ